MGCLNDVGCSNDARDSSVATVLPAHALHGVALAWANHFGGGSARRDGVVLWYRCLARAVATLGRHAGQNLAFLLFVMNGSPHSPHTRRVGRSSMILHSIAG